MEVAPTFQLRSLSVGQLYLVLGETIPEILGELHALFGGEMAEIEDGGCHASKLPVAPIEGKRLADRPTGGQVHHRSGREESHSARNHSV